MKYKIETKESIIYVTKPNNWLRRILGKKEIIERYKTKNEKFANFTGWFVFYRPNGSIVSPLDDMCSVLNDYLREW